MSESGATPPGPPAFSLWRAWRTPRVIATALRVALLVGTVLNLINQGPVIWAGGAPSWLHLALNYLVPYCVSSYSAARALVAASRG